ncbi:hypothetical protein CUMW_198970 [Citrus unshiu]|nr:hypothetical protein CUMW_198970 [Citrus unshiu]
MGDSGGRFGFGSNSVFISNPNSFFLRNRVHAPSCLQQPRTTISWQAQHTAEHRHTQSHSHAQSHAVAAVSSIHVHRHCNFWPFLERLSVLFRCTAVSFDSCCRCWLAVVNGTS